MSEQLQSGEMGQVRLVDPAYREKPVDQATVSAIGKLLRISVVITSGLVILQSLGYSVSGVLAFGGIGGLAVGFAAKDLLPQRTRRSARNRPSGSGPGQFPDAPSASVLPP